MNLDERRRGEEDDAAAKETALTRKRGRFSAASRTSFLSSFGVEGLYNSGLSGPASSIFSGAAAATAAVEEEEEEIGGATALHLGRFHSSIFFIV